MSTAERSLFSDLVRDIAKVMAKGIMDGYVRGRFLPPAPSDARQDFEAMTRAVYGASKSK
jgi:hypothetical protein